MNKFSGFSEIGRGIIILFVVLILLGIIYSSQYHVEKNAFTSVNESNVSIKELREIDKLAAEIRQIRSDTAGSLFSLKVVALFVTVIGAVGGYIVGQSKINRQRINFENRKEVDSIYQSIVKDLADKSPILRCVAAVKLGNILQSFPKEWEDHLDKDNNRRDRIIELTKRVLAASLAIEEEPTVLKTLTIAIYEIKNRGDMHYIDFSSANANDSYWAGVDFSHADFYMAKLNKASFRKATLCWAQFRESKMNEAVLIKSDCTEANFKLAELRDADCTEANFKLANLRDADCTEANFKLADLRDADFTGAKLIKTKFEGAKVHGTILKDTKIGDNENFLVDISPAADGSTMITVQEWFKMQGSKH